MEIGVSYGRGLAEVSLMLFSRRELEDSVELRGGVHFFKS